MADLMADLMTDSPRAASKSSQDDRGRSRKPGSSMTLTPRNAPGFLVLMSDALRLPEETLAMAFVYTNKYLKFLRDDPSAAELLDEHTLALASLSLATKATEAPRRLREFLLPAYVLLNPTAPPLTFPSTLYDSLRTTLVTAELLLLRVLKFELRQQLPFDHLRGLLTKGTDLQGTLRLDELNDEDKEAETVVDVRDTSLGRATWVLAGEAVRSYRLVNLFEPQTVAVACFYVAAMEAGLEMDGDTRSWLKRYTKDKVYIEDFEDAVKDVEELRR